ncbi:hypothetical protein [Streptomyces cirratus]|uniref:hypothetical protein n=1 Tax=Streptomyces cirratus TaxID=68187 RepID=UPI00167F008F|nr:hypothetical protein [Streptomyces cirratus]
MATVLAGGLATAESASANTSPGGCRTTGWASEPGGVQLWPCSSGDGSVGINATVHIRNPNAIDIFPCAQLLQVNSNGTTTQVGDFGCIGAWTNGAPDLRKGPIGVHQGTYVVVSGFWATIDGHYGYYGGAQSATIKVF